MKPGGKAMPDVLARPLAGALARLNQEGLTAIVKETSLPDQPPVGSELRVVRATITQGVVNLVTARFKTWPADAEPPL
ncbi:MAG: hypothetical protein GX952_04590 [Firmicutes bacterium]|nr:hypothetical protein [Bacillota bacterium]